MKIKNIGPNQIELIISPRKSVFCSYETTVACYLDGEFFRTSEKFSRTTTKHINGWLGEVNATEKPQSFFNAIVR